MIVLPEWSSLGLFVIAALVLLVTPGPAVLYIVTRSIDQGRRAGLVSVAGVHVGTLAHIVAAAVGLSALLAASATAFSIVKYLGAAYLIYIGVRRLLERRAPTASGRATGSGCWDGPPATSGGRSTRRRPLRGRCRGRPRASARSTGSRAGRAATGPRSPRSGRRASR